MRSRTHALSIAFAIALTSSSMLVAQDTKPIAKPATRPKLETTNQKASYIIGQDIGTNMRSKGVELDIEAFLTGLREALAGEKSVLDAKVTQATMEAFQKELGERGAKKAAAAAKKNVAEGEAFLDKNKKLDGVMTTASGLQYKVLKVGTGAKPTAEDSVTVHYHGTLLDGTVFDSSVQRNQPATFPVTGVIKGWIEGLQLMPLGSKWKFFIPSELAYGATPRPGGPIGPHAVLVFEVELLKIN